MTSVVPQSNYSLRFYTNILCICAAVFTGVYLIFRALYVPPFSDEVTTFFQYQATSDFLPWSAKPDANNHILNSAFGALTSSLLGQNLFALRLPNLLGFLVLVVYAWKLRLRFKNILTGTALFLTLVFTDYFITFFHLNRGYGMSVAFLTGALYHCICYASGEKQKHFYAGLLMLSLAVVSNLTLLLTVLGSGGIFTLLFIYRLWSQWSLAHFAGGAAALSALFIYPVFVMVKHGMYLKQNGFLFHGGEKFFDTLCLEFPREFIEEGWWGPALFGGIALIYVSAIVFSVAAKKIWNPVLPVHLILLGSVAGVIVLHLLQGVMYPKDRGALYFFPLLMAGFYFALDGAEKRIWHILAWAPTLIFSVHFFLNMNLYANRHWKAEMFNEEMYSCMENWSKKNGRKPTFSSPMLPGWAYTWYNFRHGGALSPILHQECANVSADFIMINGWTKPQEFRDFEEVMRNHDTGVKLLQRKTLVDWIEKGSVTKADTSLNVEFIGGELDGTPFAGNYMAFETEMDIHVKMPAFFLCLVVEAQDTKGGKTSHYIFELKEVMQNIDTMQHLNFRNCVYPLRAETDLIKCYLWNPTGYQVEIKNFKVKFFTPSGPIAEDNHARC